MDRTLWLSVRALVGLLFFQHGAEKLWGFAGGRIDHNFYTLHGIAGPLEAIGGALIAAGILTTPVAFLLCGEMAVAYFMTWAPRGFFPIANGGEESVLFCFLFLWMMTAGASSAKLAVWEPQARSILRCILGFLFTLHGLRLAFGILSPMAGRRLAAPMAIDQLGAAAGYFVLLFGILLALGFYSRIAAAGVSVIAFAAYLFFALPRGPWPIRNGGTEALLYALAGLYLAFIGPGAWCLDRWRTNVQPADLLPSKPSSESAPLPR
jgi:putative oxidoreductase